MFSNKKIKVEVIFNETTYQSALASTFIWGNMGQLTPKSQLIFDDFKVDMMFKNVISPIGPNATIKIYGVSKEHLDAITTVLLRDELEIDYTKRVRVWVDNGSGYIKLFEGCINEAVPVYQTAPECYIQIESSMAAYENSLKLPPISFSGESAAISLESVCEAVCAQYGVKCTTSVGIKTHLPVPRKTIGENDEGLGIRVGKLSEMYDIKAVRTMDGYEFYLKEENTERMWGFTPSNMIGYPSYKNRLLQITTDDFSGIKINDKFRISGSEITYANGSWFVTKITYNLQSRTPNGKWQATIEGAPSV